MRFLGPASIAVSAIADGATSFSASVRHQATDWAFGKQIPCDAAKAASSRWC